MQIDQFSDEELVRIVLGKAIEMGDDEMSEHTARMLVCARPVADASARCELAQRLLDICEQLEQKGKMSE